MTKLRVLDLFSGIGGFSLGLEAAGFETAAFCEVSPVCRHLLAHHWPKVPCYDDIRTLTAERLASDGIGVDAICGGFPCQDLSYAGKGAGLAGERSGLWRDYARLICELRPQFVIVENVSALLGRGLGDVLGDLAALGYDAWWDCIPASAVGAPHRRDRVWIVAYARSEQHEGYSLALRRAVASELSRAAMADTLKHNEQGFVAGQLNAKGRSGSNERPAGPRHDGGGGGGSQSVLGLLADGLSAKLDSLHGGWSEEPEIPRVATGIAARAAQLHGLGNAVVPAIPELIGRAILTAMASESLAA